LNKGTPVKRGGPCKNSSGLGGIPAQIKRTKNSVQEGKYSRDRQFYKGGGDGEGGGKRVRWEKKWRARGRGRGRGHGEGGWKGKMVGANWGGGEARKRGG